MTISLVIPGRNCQRTIAACLDAVVPLLADGQLQEIIFVDDGSTDDTASIVRRYPVTSVQGQGGGAGAARNLGWRAAKGDWIWFIDSDCVAQPDALAILLKERTDDRIAGIGGSYTNLVAESLVARLIHEEIVARHDRMKPEVNFLATFNVLYRRSSLEKVGGFDECRYNGPGVAAAEDAELAFRLVKAGYRLRFNATSRVGHFHPTKYYPYLRVQQRHGFYRVRLYLDYPQRTQGDSYSGFVDHVQPPLAMLTLACLPLLAIPTLYWAPLLLVLVLVFLQLPMTFRLISRCRSLAYAAFIPFGFLRAFWRGWGMTMSVFDYLGHRWFMPKSRHTVSA